MADMEESGKYMCTNVCDIFMLVGQNKVLLHQAELSSCELPVDYTIYGS